MLDQINQMQTEPKTMIVTGASQGSPRGDQRPRRREAAFGIARQSDPVVRLGVSVATPGDVRDQPKVARRFGRARKRLWKRQEPLPPGVWRRKPSARHAGRAGSDL